MFFLANAVFAFAQFAVAFQHFFVMLRFQLYKLFFGGQFFFFANGFCSEFGFFDQVLGMCFGFFYFLFVSFAKMNLPAIMPATRAAIAIMIVNMLRSILSHPSKWQVAKIQNRGNLENC
jgi:hypothetical protein